jgi:hypothetical protein
MIGTPEFVPDPDYVQFADYHLRLVSGADPVPTLELSRATLRS